MVLWLSKTKRRSCPFPLSDDAAMREDYQITQNIQGEKNNLDQILGTKSHLCASLRLKSSASSANTKQQQQLKDKCVWIWPKTQWCLLKQRLTRAESSHALLSFLLIMGFEDRGDQHHGQWSREKKYVENVVGKNLKIDGLLNGILTLPKWYFLLKQARGVSSMHEWIGYWIGIMGSFNSKLKGEHRIRKYQHVLLQILLLKNSTGYYSRWNHLTISVGVTLRSSSLFWSGAGTLILKSWILLP